MGNLYVANKLYANPSTIEGMSRVVDLGATMQVYNTSETDEQADFEALRNDWCAVGDDFRFAIKKYGQQTAKQ
jgi:hypothetical protein